MGSKSAIAPWVLSCLPPGDTLVDLFCGGCAVTDAAIRSHRYKKFIFNDINPMMPSAYLKALAGGFKGEDRWISREDFVEKKDTDEYAAICFSFGNNLNDYLYSRTIEPYKKACHYAVVFDDWRQMRKLCSEVVDAAYKALKHVDDRHERRLKFGPAILRRLKEIGDPGLIDNNPLYSSCYVNQPNRTRPVELECLERLERLINLERLERLDYEIFSLDYREVPIPEGAVVYCDPPYKGTQKYLVEFDHKAFYQWVLSRPFPVFISEYNMPDDFVPIAIKQKTSSLSAVSIFNVAEKIFVQRRYADKYKRDLFL